MKVKINALHICSHPYINYLQFLVLGDPQKKAIYDVLGVKGLEMDGWQVSSLKNL